MIKKTKAPDEEQILNGEINPEEIDLMDDDPALFDEENLDDEEHIR